LPLSLLEMGVTILSLLCVTYKNFSISSEARQAWESGDFTCDNASPESGSSGGGLIGDQDSAIADAVWTDNRAGLKSPRNL
jgi:hypothetical protein